MAAGILSKGIKLSYKTSASGSYTQIPNLQECPSLGGKVDKVEVTTLENSAHTYIQGLKDYGDMDFKFLFDNADATSNYRICKGLEGENIYWQVEFPDAVTASTGHGTQFQFEAQPSVSIDSAGTNVAATFTLSLAVYTDITVVDPV